MATRAETATPLTADAQRLGAALRARRKALGVNMTAAAEAAGMSRVTWHRLEKGEPTVAWGLLLAAAAVLGMDLDLAIAGDVIDAPDPLRMGALPLQVPLADFPGLRGLAWQVGERVDALTPREALDVYMRNLRHLDLNALTERERLLMRALRDAFGEALPGV